MILPRVEIQKRHLGRFLGPYFSLLLAGVRRLPYPSKH